MNISYAVIRTFLWSCLFGCLISCSQADMKKQENEFWQRGAIRGYFFGVRADDFTLNEMQAMGINLVRGGINYRLGPVPDPQQPVNAEAIQHIQACNATGIHTMGSVSCIRVFWEELFKQYPEAEQHVVRKKDGSIQLWHDRPTEYIANLLDPYWLNLHSKGVQYAVNAGLDLLHLDNPLMIFSYDERTQQLWKEYVQNALGRERAQDKDIQVDKPQQLELDEDLLGEIPLLYDEADASRDPVIRANLQVFQFSHYLKFLKKLKQVANDAGGIKFDFTAHMGAKDLYYWTEGRHDYDVICIENSNANTFWFAPEGEGLFGYMVAYACSNDKPTWVINKLLYRLDEPIWTGTRYYNFLWHTPSPDRHELYMAEAAAMGGIIGPVTPTTGYVQTFNRKYENYPETVKRYFSFQRDWEKYQVGTTSPAKTALLISHKSYLFEGGDYKMAMFGMAELLLKRHIPFDVIVVENEESMQLDGYSTLIAVHLSILAEETAAVINRQTSAGTDLLVIGEYGTRHPDNFLEREKSLLQNNTNIDKSRLHRASADATELYQKFNAPYPQNSDRYLSVLQGKNGTFDVQTAEGGDELVVMIPWLKKDDLVLHCLNYNFNLLEDATEEERLHKEQVLSQTDVRITVDKTMLPNVSSAYYMVPGVEPKEIKVNRNANGVTLTIPKLDVYGMIILKGSDAVL